MSNEITRCPISFTKKAEYDSSDFRFIEVSVDVLHTGANKNGSYFTKEVVDAATPSIANTPILGYVLYDENNNVIDFKGHEHELRIDDEGIKYVYSGSAYGVIPESCNPRWVLKDDGEGNEREYLRVDGLLWTKFDAPCEIFSRDIEKNHSMEIVDIQGETDKDDGLYHVSSFLFDGCCVLSTTDPQILPAMTGSNMVANFSADSVAAQIKQKLNEFSIIKNGTEKTKEGDLEPMIDEANMPCEETGIENAEFVADTNETSEPSVDETTIVEETEFSAENSDEASDSSEPAETYIQESDEESEPEQESNDAEFSLTINQLFSEIYNQLREPVIVRYGYEYPRYELRDIQDNEAIVLDAKDGLYDAYGIPYSMDGDNVVLHFDEMKRKKTVYEDWVDGETVEPMANPIQNIVNAFSEKIDSLTETANAYAEIKPKYDAYVVAEEQRKSEEMTAKRNQLFELMDKQLGDDADYQALKENTEIDFSELETKCYALYGKKSAEFSYTPNPKQANSNVRFGVSGNQNVDSTSVYGGLIERYGVR